MGTLKNIIGKKYGRLTVVAMSPEKMYGKIAWLCQCDCGNKLTATGNSLTRGNTKSCGCLKLDGISALRRTHGKSRSPEYITWCAMKSRCYSETNQDYQHYGGRGIRVCKRWVHSFENFLADMGTRPKPGSTLERKNVNGNYSPANCEWTSQKTQTRNKRTNHILTVDGVSLCVGEWVEKTGLNRGTIFRRIQLGWTPKAIVTTPPLKRWSTKRKDRSK